MSLCLQVLRDDRGFFQAWTRTGWCGHRHRRADTAFSCIEATPLVRPQYDWSARPAPREVLLKPKSHTPR